MTRSSVRNQLEAAVEPVAELLLTCSPGATVGS
jgi:hypothetical protein